MNKLQQLIDRIFFAGEIERLADDNLALIKECGRLTAALRKLKREPELVSTHSAIIRVEENTAGAYEWSAKMGDELIDRGQRSTAADAKRDAVAAVMAYVAEHGGTSA
jgi:hypothetical protein